MLVAESAERALAIMGESRDLLRNFFQVSQAMYAVGSGLQQDVLRAQVEVSNLEAELVRLRQQLASAQARLARQLADTIRAELM